MLFFGIGPLDYQFRRSVAVDCVMDFDVHSKNRERYINSLVAAGYLQLTNPDNPTASNQKYKKVVRK